MSEEDFASLQDVVWTTSRTSTTSERQSESTLDDLMGEFGEASAPRADMDDFDIEIASSASNQPSEASEASSAAATGVPPTQAQPVAGTDGGGPVYSYPMGFEMNKEEEGDDDVIPEMEASLIPVRHERSLSFGAAEVIEYEQVVMRDEDLIGADREMNDDDDEDEEDDEEVDLHFPVGAADDYRPPNKDHLISSETGFDDPFEHHHTRTEEDSEDDDLDLDREEIRRIPAEGRDGYGDLEELREGAVNRTGFADDVVDDGLDKAEIRNFTEARTKVDKFVADGGECHFKERKDSEPTQRDSFGFGDDQQEEGDDDHQGAAQVTHTSHTSMVFVSTHIM